MGSGASKAFLNNRLDGKTVLVTGANTGIGKATAKQLYHLGARVIMACRDVKKAENAVTEIQSEIRAEEKVGEIVIKHLNLSSLASVRKCADEIISDEGKLHILINNAGVMMCPQGKTEDGFETHFGVNHLGHFLFTCLLLPKIINSAPAKIITVSSMCYKSGEVNLDDLNFEKRKYSPFGAYAQSKLANIMFSVELANKLKGTKVAVYSVHPGIVRTELSRHIDEAYFSGASILFKFVLFPFYKTVDEGALTTLYCALNNNDDENVSGYYYSDFSGKGESMSEKYGETSKNLWTTSAKLVDCDFNLFSSDASINEMP